MYICLCNNVTETTIRRAVESGIRNFEDLVFHTGVSAGCGTCVQAAQSCFSDAKRNHLRAVRQFSIPVLQVA